MNPFLLLPLQSFEHDAYRCWASLWTHGGRVEDQRGTDGETVDDWVGDTEASQDKHPLWAAGEVQECFPDGQQERRGGTLWCPSSGCSFLWAAQSVVQLAPWQTQTWTSATHYNELSGLNSEPLWIINHRFSDSGSWHLYCYKKNSDLFEFGMLTLGFYCVIWCKKISHQKIV